MSDTIRAMLECEHGQTQGHLLDVDGKPGLRLPETPGSVLSCRGGEVIEMHREMAEVTSCTLCAADAPSPHTSDAVWGYRLVSEPSAEAAWTQERVR